MNHRSITYFKDVVNEWSELDFAVGQNVEAMAQALANDEDPQTIDELLCAGRELIDQRITLADCLRRITDP